MCFFARLLSKNKACLIVTLRAYSNLIGGACKMLKTLIVYYSKTGTTATVAKMIATAIDGDLFELEPVTTFPDDMYATSAVSTEQYEKDQLPALKQLPDLTKYERILIGTPTWSSRLATPVASFIKHTDFGDKEVRFFATSVGQTTGLEADFASQLLTGQLGQSLILGTQRPSVSEIENWLN